MVKVYALGGSVIKQEIGRLENITEAIESEEQSIIVTGAGHLKQNIEAVREHCNNAEADIVGIQATRLNAKTIQTLLNNSYPKIPETIEQLEEAASSDKNVVMGGLNPGFSTDAVAALAAELLEAELYIITDIDSIYDKDPRKNNHAQKLEQTTVEKLLEITSGSNKPGVYSVIDSTALKIIQRSRIKTRLFEGKPENIENSETCPGTDILTE